MKPHQFASDNYSGICPEALQAFLAANEGHAPAYGNDRWTAEASDLLRELFDADCEVFFVFNGTSANGLALAALAQPYHSMVVAECAHVETDECGAPEFFSSGTKLLLGATRSGKLDPASIRALVTKRTDIHYPKPKLVSVTQATETGTVYTREELLAIRNVCDRYHLRLQMDGARFANACAHLDCKPREISWECGVDALCFGGSKNGLPVGELVIFFERELAQDFEYRCKQAGQLASKMRFLAAPCVGLLKTGAWLRNARNANACARLLEAELSKLPGLQILYPVQANAVFVRLPEHVAAALRDRGWIFYTFIGDAARFMCSWDTRKEHVRALAQDLREILGG